MGKYCSSGKSKFIFRQKNYKNAYLALNFVDDDEKSDQENLIDCLSDFYVKCTQSSPDSLTCILADENSDDDFDWNFMFELSDFLDEGSFYEQIHIDQTRILVGTIRTKNNKNHLVRDFHQLIIDENDRFVRGEFIENFDTDLALD